MNIIERLFGKRVGEKAISFEEPRRLSDEELLDSIAVDERHPVLLAVQECIERAQIEARDSAREVVGNHSECAYFLGAEWAMENLRDYLRNLRVQANARLAQRLKEQEREG